MVRYYPWGTTGIYTTTNSFQCSYQIFFFFIKKTDIRTFADDTTTYACEKELDAISFKLAIETNIATPWLKGNEMVANLSNVHLIFLSK